MNAVAIVTILDKNLGSINIKPLTTTGRINKLLISGYMRKSLSYFEYCNVERKSPVLNDRSQLSIWYGLIRIGANCVALACEKQLFSCSPPRCTTMELKNIYKLTNAGWIVGRNSSTKKLTAACKLCFASVLNEVSNSHSLPEIASVYAFGNLL